MTITNVADNNHFSTEDTALAAWLYSQGHNLLEVKAKVFPSSFIFENISPSLAEDVRSFQCGKAEGNIFVFYKAYKKLVRMIKEERG